VTPGTHLLWGQKVKGQGHEALKNYRCGHGTFVGADFFCLYGVNTPRRTAPQRNACSVNVSLERNRCLYVCVRVCVCVDVSVEDSGNYTCDVFGRRSVVLASVTHTVIVRGTVTGWLEFNVPFQHKYGYIRDETSRVESYPYPLKEGQRHINLNPGRLFVQQTTKLLR